MTLGAALLAALAGSVHCGAMCGAFAAACGARGVGPGIGYQLGRLASYLALGALAGALGQGVDALGARLAGVQQLAALLMGATLVFLAIRMLRPARIQIDEPRRGVRPLARLLRRGGVGGATGVGLLTAFLPCGWLWGFVALAAASGGALAGAGILGALWLGGLPILVAVGGLATRLGALRRWRFTRPALATGLLLAGLWSLTGHWLPQLLGVEGAVAADARCHAP
ncbi:MAG: sulfite exporter TauE/SafE family protein [bacterium]